MRTGTFCSGHVRVMGDGIGGGSPMSPHRFDPEASSHLEETIRYRYLSRDELVGALAPTRDHVVVDLGSGTGFYTREVAPFVDRVHAVDMQAEMHDEFRKRGVPDNVETVLAKADDLPFADEYFDAAYSTMTFHEYDPEGPAEIRRVLSPGGTLVVADWSAEGSGERGPPLDVRYDTQTATREIEAAGFEVSAATSRPETFFIEARRP